MRRPKTRPVEIQRPVNVIVFSYDDIFLNYSFNVQTHGKAIKVKPIVSSYNGKNISQRKQRNLMLLLPIIIKLISLKGKIKKKKRNKIISSCYYCERKLNNNICFYFNSQLKNISILIFLYFSPK